MKTSQSRWKHQHHRRRWSALSFDSDDTQFYRFQQQQQQQWSKSITTKHSVDILWPIKPGQMLCLSSPWLVGKVLCITSFCPSIIAPHSSIDYVLFQIFQSFFICIKEDQCTIWCVRATRVGIISNFRCCVWWRGNWCLTRRTQSKTI